MEKLANGGTSSHVLGCQFHQTLQKGWNDQHQPTSSQADYYVHVSRREKRPKGYVWPILLTQELPVIGIPLMPEDPDAQLNLQQILNSAYDRAAYDLEVDYQKDPLPPLSEAGSVWINQVLNENGLRKSV